MNSRCAKFINAYLQAPLLQADILRVFQEGLVISPDIEDDREDTVRLKTSSCHVHVQLPDGNCHSTAAQVTEAEDPGAIGHDDRFNLRFTSQRVIGLASSGSLSHSYRLRHCRSTYDGAEEKKL